MAISELYTPPSSNFSEQIWVQKSWEKCRRHRLTLFCILFICLNMYVYKFKKVKYYKRIPLFVLLISLLLFALSTQNDNNTFFILYPLFALFLYSILYTIDYKRIGKLCLCVLGGIIALAVVWISTDWWEQMCSVLSVFKSLSIQDSAKKHNRGLINMSKYFGTDGFRGEAGITLTADHAYKVGRFLQQVSRQLLRQ